MALEHTLLIGAKYGRLTITSTRPPETQAGTVTAICECGTTKNYQLYSLKKGTTTSCGCLRRGAARYHGHAISENVSPTYRIWAGMRQRCNTPSWTSYKDYGGRGIKVCERWDNFENFLADMGERPASMTLDRINHDGDYEPTNCRWADRKTQANNRRSNRNYEINGETKNIAEWCAIYGMRHQTACDRIDRRWPPKKALTIPPLRSGEKFLKPQRVSD